MQRSLSRTVLVGIFVATFLALHTYVKITQPEAPTASPWSFTHYASGVALPQLAQRAQSSRLTLVIFFESPCDPCRDALMALQQLYSDRHDGGLEVVGVFSGGASTQRFAQSLGARFPLMHDTDGMLARQWGVSIKPTCVLLDPTMHVLQTNVGFDQDFLHRVEAMLDEASP